MKKSIATAVFIIGISTCSLGMTVLAAQNKEESVGTNSLLKENVLEEGCFSEKNVLPEMNPKRNENLLGIEAAEKKSDDKEKESEDKNPENDSDAGMSEVENLQIPQKLEIVIDPWEMDGKSQIYSEQYTIRNTGEAAGVLTLSQLICRPQEKGDVIVRTDKDRVHDTEEKSLYMEMIFGNGESVALSEEGTEYRAVLKSGEELSFWFAGEVNEYAAEGWKDEDVAVGVVYSWDEEAIAEGVNEDVANRAPDIDDDPMNENKMNENEMDEADAGDEELTNLEMTGNEEELPQIDDFVSEQKDGEKEKKIIKVVDLPANQKSKITIDSWEIEENSQGNRIISEEYVLRNAGEVPGTLILEELRCKTSKDICMEMVLGTGESMRLPQESSEYQVELKPGEEVRIWFTGEMNGSMPEELEKGVVEVTAVCFFECAAEKYDLENKVV